MLTDTELKKKGYEILTRYLGEVEAERFIALIQREPFDYTRWRQKNLPDAETIEELSKMAMECRKKENLEPQKKNPPSDSENPMKEKEN